MATAERKAWGTIEEDLLGNTICLQLRGDRSLAVTLHDLQRYGVQTGKPMQGGYVMPVWNELALGLFPIVGILGKRIVLNPVVLPTTVIKYECSARGGVYFSHDWVRERMTDGR